MSLTTRLVVVLASATLVLFLALSRLQVSFDLAFFLPEPSSSAESVLIDRLGAGPGSQLVIVHAPDADSETLRSLAQRLRAGAEFRSVLPAEQQLSIASLPPVIWRNRLLLTDLPGSVDDWRWEFESRLADLSVANDPGAINLIAADPALSALSVLERLGGANSLPEGMVVASTQAPAFDLDAQQHAIAALRAELAGLGLVDARLFGSPVYGVDLQASVRAESILFSTLASIGLLALLIWRLRRASFVLAAAAPLLAGAAGALLSLSWLFNSVHGITLAFGFTLLGVAIDYPLHLLSVARQSGLGGNELARQVWPTLRVGVASTLIGYLAFLLSGSTGLQQLGVMAIAGIAVSALASAWLARGLTTTSESHETPDGKTNDSRQLVHWPWLLILLASAGLFWNLEPFNDDLSALTPLPKERLAADGKLRAAMGADDLRRLIVLRDEDLQRLLRRTENLEAPLNKMVLNSELDGYRLASDLLPSFERQTTRRAQARSLLSSFEPVTQALQGLPFEASSFKPFTDALAEVAKRDNWLEIDDIEASRDLAPLLSSMLYKSEDQIWTSLVLLSGVSTSLPTLPDGEVIDLKEASISMVSRFRSSLLTVLSLALGAMLAILFVGTRSAARSLWIAGCTGAAITLSATVSALALGGLNLFAVVALALVAGLGLDYGLFHSKKGNASQSASAVALCAASSLTVFALLALSSIPLLRSIGLTVALGVATAWLLTRYARRVIEQ